MISRRILLQGAMALAASPLYAEAPTTSPLPKPRPKGLMAGKGASEDLIAAAGLDADFACLVVDAKTGKVLESINSDAGMAPASVEKVLSAMFAYDRLGPSYRFKTKLVRDGKAVGLLGGGDPMLTTDHLAELAARAVGKISGKVSSFRFDQRALPFLPEIDAEQPVHVGYNPAISGLNLNLNQVHFEWKKQGGDWVLSMEARTDKLRPAVDLTRIEIKERSVPVYTYRYAGAREHWTVASAALGKGGSRWLPVRHPGAYGAEVFRTLVRAQGIDLPQPQEGQVGGDVIAEFASAPLEVILRQMLEHSINVVAEGVGLGSSGKSTLSASAAEMESHYISEYGLKFNHLHDHSGLGASTRVTAQQLVAFLTHQRVQSVLPALLKTFPIRDAKGKAVKNHPVKVVAKTGTLNFVSTLAGYASLPSGRTLAFAILNGDLERRSKANASGEDVPAGVGKWTKASRLLQSRLLENWGRSYA